MMFLRYSISGWFGLHFLTSKLLILSVLLVFWSMPGAAAQASAKKHVSSKHHARHHRRRKVSWKRKGQQQIQPDRAREIQEALIREKYLTGEPSGKWDTRTQAAMTRYQADNGWQ